MHIKPNINIYTKNHYLPLCSGPIINLHLNASPQQSQPSMIIDNPRVIIDGKNLHNGKTKNYFEGCTVYQVSGGG